MSAMTSPLSLLESFGKYRVACQAEAGGRGLSSGCWPVRFAAAAAGRRRASPSTSATMTTSARPRWCASRPCVASGPGRGGPHGHAARRGLTEARDRRAALPRAAEALAGTGLHAPDFVTGTPNRVEPGAAG